MTRRAEDIAVTLASVAGQARGGAELLTGVVQSWNATGGYIVTVLSVQVSDVPVLASAGVLQAGDPVAVLRQRSSYLVLGKIITPGG